MYKRQVVLDTVWSAPDLAAFEQDLEHFASGDAGAKLAGHDGRGAASFLEVDAGFVGQVVAVQQRRRQADQKANGLFQFRVSRDLKILFERHVARQEVKQCLSLIHI